MSNPATFKALDLLWQMAQHDNGGARVCARLLLGLYNGPRFPFDLTDLRLLDEQYLSAAFLVLRMDARPAMEVHEVLNHIYGVRTMGARFELLACDWGFKGRCSKAQERDTRLFLAEQARSSGNSTPRPTTPALLRAVP